jgi:hypothetical protein
MAEQVLILGQSDHAVANVTRWKDAIFTAKASGAAAIIGDGDDGGQVGYRPEEVGGLIAPATHVFLYAAEKGGKARAAAKRHYVETPRVSVRFKDAFFQRDCTKLRAIILPKIGKYR